MESIQWNCKRHVYVNRELSVAFVKTGGGYMEFDDFREGGPMAECLPPYSEFVGTFTIAQISNMDYPE